MNVQKTTTILCSNNYIVLHVTRLNTANSLLTQWFAERGACNVTQPTFRISHFPLNKYVAGHNVTFHLPPLTAQH